MIFTSKIFLPLRHAFSGRRESGEGWQNDTGQNDNSLLLGETAFSQQANAREGLHLRTSGGFRYDQIRREYNWASRSDAGSRLKPRYQRVPGSLRQRDLHPDRFVSRQGNRDADVRDRRTAGDVGG